MLIKESVDKSTDFIPDGMTAFERNVKRIGDCLLAFIALVAVSYTHLTLPTSCKV